MKSERNVVLCTMRALWTISINLSCGSDFWNFSRRSVFVDPDVFKKLLLWVVKSFTTDHNNSSFFPILLFFVDPDVFKKLLPWVVRSFTTNYKQCSVVALLLLIQLLGRVLCA